MRAMGFALALAWVQIVGSQAVAQEVPRQQAEAQARALVARGQGAQAIPLLKAEIERDPRRRAAPPAARAYLDDGNDFWALRTVAAAADLHLRTATCRSGWPGFRSGRALDQAPHPARRRLLPLAAREDPPALLSAMPEQAARRPSAGTAG